MAKVNVKKKVSLRDSIKSATSSYLKPMEEQQLEKKKEENKETIEQVQQTQKPEEKETRRKIIEPNNTELRTKRKQFVLAPSIHDKALKKCKELNVSMNEVVNQLLKYWLDEDE